MLSQLRTLSIALSLVVAPALPSVAFAASETTARVAELREAPRAQPGSTSDVARYSEREAASPKASEFKGGNTTIIIGASTLTVILAVALLVVLL